MEPTEGRTPGERSPRAGTLHPSPLRWHWELGTKLTGSEKPETKFYGCSQVVLWTLEVALCARIPGLGHLHPLGPHRACMTLSQAALNPSLVSSSLFFSPLVNFHFLQLRGLVSLLGNAQQMSRLKTGVPAPHPPPGVRGARMGVRSLSRGLCQGTAAGLEDSVCSSSSRLIEYLLSYT